MTKNTRCLGILLEFLCAIQNKLLGEKKKEENQCGIKVLLFQL